MKLTIASLSLAAPLAPAAEHVALVKRISGVAEVKPLTDMVAQNWPLGSTAGGGRGQAAPAISGKGAPPVRR